MSVPDKTMSLADALEEVGNLISRAGGEGYAAFEVIQDALADAKGPLRTESVGKALRAASTGEQS